MTTKYFTCPVCGYPKLENIPWTEDLRPSWDICPSCGTHFGNNDFGTSLEEVYNRHITLRKEWIKNGMKWGWSMKLNRAVESVSYPRPSNWDPIQQLKNIPAEFLDVNEKY